MSVIGSNVLAGASGSGVAGYEIERSLRFNSGDSAYLNKTFSSAGNRKTWTWSGWVKLSKINSINTLFAAGSGIWTGGQQTTLAIYSDNTLWLFDYNGGYQYQKKSNAVFRDPSAWQHIVVAVDTTDSTAADRVKLYVNGERISDFASSSDPDPDYQTFVNNNVAHYVSLNTTNEGFDGYLADVHFIDGQALAATDFGEFDDNNVWQPKEYSGSYGTNGFYLDFSDNSSASALGTDAAGSNDWTVNNLSVASGAGNDSLIDTPTNGTQTDTGAGGEVVGNYATLNPLHLGLASGSNVANAASLSDGNLRSLGAAGKWGAAIATMPIPSSGKWYMEFTCLGTNSNFGLCKPVYALDNTIRTSTTSKSVWYGFNGFIHHYINSIVTDSTVDTYTTNDIIGIAVDSDAYTIKYYKNNNLQYTQTLVSALQTELDAGNLFPVVDTYAEVNAIVNFGQRAFAYTAPSGFKALCTTNLPDPTIADGSTAFDVDTWSGDDTDPRSRTLSFGPDLVWIKTRNQTNWHYLTDSVRGAPNKLYTNSTDGEDTTPIYGQIDSLNSDGFTLGGGTNLTNPLSDSNQSGTTYVAWAWDGGTSTVSNTDGSITSSVRANASAGFSIVTWSGTGSSGTIGHGLNASPYLVIGKCRNTSSTTWLSYHNELGGTKFIELNNTNPAGTASTAWNDTDPTSSVIHVGTSSGINGSGRTYVAYCFAPVEGYSAFGSYIGNGSADGPFVYTGFRPRWVLVKMSSGTSSWQLLDSARSNYNVMDDALFPNLSNAETVASAYNTDFLSNGFKIRDADSFRNGSGSTFIYAAFAEHPFKTARAR